LATKSTTSAEQGFALRPNRMFATKFSKETCDCGLMFSPSPLWRASEGRRPESESKQNVCEPPWGEAFEYIRCRFSAPSLPLARAPPGAKPSSTPAVVFRPPSLPLRKPHGGRSLRVRPPPFFAPLSPLLRELGGEAFEYIRCRFASPSPLRRTPPGRSLQVRLLSFIAPLFSGGLDAESGRP